MINRRLARIIALMLTISLCLLFSAAPAYCDNVRWNSYETGMKKMVEENKKGFLHFYTDWCTYCKLMNKKTFSNEAVAGYLNRNFIPIRVNAEDEKHVASEYGVHRFPNNWFLTEDQETIGKRPGYIEPAIFLDMLKYVESESFASMSFQEYMDNKE
jgi:thioredoxin-related protein